MTENSIEIRAIELFELACDQPSDKRLVWIKEQTANEIELQNQVLTLLKNDQSEDSIVATGQAIRAAYKNTEIKIPTKIGSYTITRLIGEGGMGAVYEGVRNNDDFDHKVAIKVIKPGLLSRSITERFFRERQVLASLNHPGIARLFDGGQLEDGSPYFVMEYVDGTPITSYADEHGLTIDERLELFLNVCRATQYAHTNLIVHRDITSSNVIVSKTGVVKLIDFGIAKPESNKDASGVSEQPSLASLSFTPGFAAPERLLGAPVTLLTDVFSLGRLLEVMLDKTDKSSELDAIIQQAIEPDPNRRYRSVDLLQADVERFLSNQPLSVIENTKGYVLKKFWKRNKVQTLLGTSLAAAVISGLITSLFLADKAQTEAQIAKANLAEAEYFLKKSEVFIAGSNAFADALQRSFGGTADLETQKSILLSRWQTAYDNRETDPKTASYLSYALGRHFLFRNDYQTALQIIEPWHTERFGNEQLLDLTLPMLAITYSHVGRNDDAISVFRDAAEMYASSYEAGSPDHISTVAKLANLTKDELDLEAAETLLMQTLEENENLSSGLVAFYWSELAYIRENRGDFKGVYDARKNTLDIKLSNPSSEVSGSDTARLHLALVEFYQARDLAHAEQLALEALEISKTKGESRETGRAYYLQSLLLANQGRIKEATDKAEIGNNIIGKYSSNASGTSIDARAWLIELLAESGSVASAETELDILETKLDGLKVGQASRTRIALCRMNLEARKTGSVDTRPLSLADHEAIKRSVMLTYFYERLESND